MGVMANRILVVVVPKASRNRVEKLTDGSYKVWVTVAPDKGKANAAVAKLLAGHFDMPVSRVTLLAGETSRKKVFGLRRTA